MHNPQTTKGFEPVGRTALYHHPKSAIYHQAMVRSKVLKTWEETVEGFFNQASTLTQAIDFKNGKLYIACLSQVLASKIIAMAKSIINTLNQLLGKVLVYTLEVEC